MVFGEEENVTHAGVFCDLAPPIGVAAGGAEIGWVGDAARPFVAGERAERPADEHAEPHVGDFACADGVVLRNRCSGIGKRRGRDWRDCQ